MDVVSISNHTGLGVVNTIIPKCIFPGLKGRDSSDKPYTPKATKLLLFLSSGNTDTVCAEAEGL